MKELKIYKAGALSKAAKVELLMKALEYPASKISEVVDSMKKAKAAPAEEDDTVDKLLSKRCCEAEMLSHMLHANPEGGEKSSKKRGQNDEKKESKAKDSEGTAKEQGPKPELWPEHVKADSSEMETPPGCSLMHVTPPSASPCWRAALPGDQKFRGHHTKSKSYQHSESAGGPGSASCSSETAKAAVVAWLWEWHESQKAPSSNAASGSGGSKRQRK